MSQSLPSSFHLIIITSQLLLLETEAEEVSLPSLEGYLGILPGHRPLVVALGKGDITFKYKEEKKNYPIQGGYAEILPDRVLVFTEKSDEEGKKDRL